VKKSATVVTATPIFIESINLSLAGVNDTFVIYGNRDYYPSLSPSG